MASNSDHDHVDHVLAPAGLRDQLAGRVFSAHDVAAGKPMPDLVLHAARAMGADPEQCVVVGDSPFGVMAARAAGMRCYGYAGGLLPGQRLAQLGAVTFHHMSDLIGIFGVDQRPVAP